MKKILKTFSYSMILLQSTWVHATYDWLDPHTSEEQQDTMQALIKHDEEQKDCSVNVNNKVFGKSFPQFTKTKKMCLEEIQARYQAAGQTRIPVADIGAGHGFMSWLMLAAGGSPYIVEPNESAVDYLLTRTLPQAESFLNADETIKKNVLLSKNDFLNIQLTNKANKFEVVWVSHVLQFLTPTQLQTFITKLYFITKPNGKIFITTEIPGNEELPSLEVMRSADNRGMNYPGYVISDIYLDRSDRKIKTVKTYPLRENDTFQPGLVQLGSYQPHLKPQNGMQLPNLLHVAYHFITPEVLKREFTKADFIIDSVNYVYSSKDPRCGETVPYSGDELETVQEQQRLWVVLIGHK